MLSSALEWAYPGILIGPYAPPSECVISQGLIVEWLRAEPKPDEATLVAEYEADPTGLAADVRKNYAQQIEAQLPDASVRDSVRDPLVQADISRSLAAATDKEIELQDTDDADLDSFDPSLDVAPPQNGKGYSHFAVNIIELEPWAGAPDNYLGFEAVLNIQTQYEDQGAEARLYVVDAPADTGAVLPFVQDVEDPQKWSVNARDGFMWADPNAECTVQLLWGAGSLPTSGKLTCKGQNDRQARVVRYAVPTTRRGVRRQ